MTRLYQEGMNSDQITENNYREHLIKWLKSIPDSADPIKVAETFDDFIQSLITSIKQEERERIGNKMNSLEYIWETDAMVCFKEKIIYPLDKLDRLARCPSCEQVCMTPLMYIKYQILSLI